MIDNDCSRTRLSFLIVVFFRICLFCLICVGGGGLFSQDTLLNQNDVIYQDSPLIVNGLNHQALERGAVHLSWLAASSPALKPFLNATSLTQSSPPSFSTTNVTAHTRQSQQWNGFPRHTASSQQTTRESAIPTAQQQQMRSLQAIKITSEITAVPTRAEKLILH